MKPPRRWLDSPGVPDDMATLLRSQPLPGAMPEAAKRRGRAHAARLAAVPAGAVVSWLSAKAVAAVALVGGVAAAGVVAVTNLPPGDSVERTPPVHSRSEARDEREATPMPRVSEATEPSESVETGVSSFERDQLAPVVAAPVAERRVPTQKASPRRAAAVGPARSATVTAADPLLPPAPPKVDALQQEATLLEAARARLASDPAAALSVARRHTSEFPRGQLRLERQLIEADALGRLGRVAEARAVAARILASHPGALYEERVRALMRRWGD